MQMTTELSNIDSYTRFSDVRMSIEQEAAVRFISKIHIPSKYSPPLRTQFQSSAPRFTGVLIVGWRQSIGL